ncbi:MAG: bifunctional glutamate N-acetyltransferase/amino-acid acetyltransferase ArgJ [Pseudomonadota bacterium]
MTAVSPLAPDTEPVLPGLDGVVMATAEAGIKYQGRTDVLLMAFPEATTVAGVFTKSKCPSAPVDWCRRALTNGRARALCVNSGNANAFTGMNGARAVARTANAVSSALGCDVEDVFLASTGVIGEPLDAGRFEAVMSDLSSDLSTDGWAQAARAIMTTDTFPKLATTSIVLGDQEITISGIAKGAGMIAPDMATMLAFLATDAPISRACLQSALAAEVETSFNAITVDSDMSTSDTVLAFATGAGSARGVSQIVSRRSANYRRFRAGLSDVLHDLALQIVRDGEGARKLVSITVRGAVSRGSAKKVAFAIANSPLVKTAIAGEDANWGRVVMAVGKAGEPADRDRLQIWFGDIRVAVDGERDPDYSEEMASDYMRGQEISLTVDLGLGAGAATVWTCDLTKDYVAINGDYRS